MRTVASICLSHGAVYQLCIYLDIYLYKTINTPRKCLTILFVFSVIFERVSRSEFIIQFFNSRKLFTFNAHPSVNKHILQPVTSFPLHEIIYICL